MLTKVESVSFNPNFWDGVWWIISLAIAAIVVFVVIYAFCRQLHTARPRRVGEVPLGDRDHPSCRSSARSSTWSHGRQMLRERTA
jgi:hypothetical protein